MPYGTSVLRTQVSMKTATASAFARSLGSASHAQSSHR